MATTTSNGVNTVWEAYIIGLDPTDPSDIFSISVLCLPSSGKVIAWNAISDRVYSIYWTTNLLNSFQALETNIVFPQSSYTDTLHNSCFYKIDVKLAE